jgi:AmiR/NasT family two-component response regulator
LKTLRILVVDDESIIRIDLREMLAQMGYLVVGEACSGEEAIAKSAELGPDLVFLDIKMPGIDGLEALERMNEHALRPVIILTAFNDRGFVERAAELGAAAYIVKPFEESSILPAIHLAMSHFEELRSLRAENASLKETVEASRLVNRAKGLLAEHEGLSEREAFRKIQKMSMDKNKKIKEVAEAYIFVYGERQSR